MSKAPKDYRYLDLLPDSSMLALEEVLALVRVSRTTWYEGIKSGRYPKQVYIGPSSPRWPLHLIRAVITGNYPPSEDQKAA